MTGEHPAQNPSELDPGQVDALVEQMLGSAIPRPIVWAKLSAADAEKAWASLSAWVRQLAARYDLDGRELPPCWWRHGALVEELTALHGAWLVAYDDSQSAAAMSDWHRVFYETRHRLREWASRTGCSTHDHRDGTTPPWVGRDYKQWRAEFTAGVHDDLDRRVG